jgi:hypothetical protein
MMRKSGKPDLRGRRSNLDWWMRLLRRASSASQ